MGRNGQPDAAPQPEAPAALLLPRQELGAFFPRGPTLLPVALLPSSSCLGPHPFNHYPRSLNWKSVMLTLPRRAFIWKVIKSHHRL